MHAKSDSMPRFECMQCPFFSPYYARLGRKACVEDVHMERVQESVIDKNSSQSHAQKDRRRHKRNRTPQSNHAPRKSSFDPSRYVHHVAKPYRKLSGAGLTRHRSYASSTRLFCFVLRCGTMSLDPVPAHNYIPRLWVLSQYDIKHLIFRSCPL